MAFHRDSLSMSMSIDGDSGPMALPDLAMSDQGRTSPLCGMAGYNSSSRRRSETELKTIMRDDDMQQLKQRIKDLEEQLEDLKAKIDHQGSNGNVSNLKEELKKSRQQVAELKRQLARTESELNDTRKLLQALHKQSKLDEKKIKELQEKEQNLSKSLKMMADDLNKKEASMKQMKKTMDNLQTELKNTKEESKRSVRNLEEKMTGMFLDLQKRMDDRDARERGPCTDRGEDVTVHGDTSNDVPLTTPPPRQAPGPLNLPPITPRMNFPPRY